MNKFFKMSLVAAAVAVSGTAAAGTFTTITPVVFSSEGIELTTATEQATGNLEYTFGTDYEAGATLTFNFTAGALSANTVFPASVLIEDPATPGTDIATFTISNQSADMVEYTLTAKVGGSDVNSGVFAIPGSVFGTPITAAGGLELNTSAIVAGPVTIVAAAEYQGVTFDPDTTAVGTGNEKKNYLASASTQFGTYAVATPGTHDFDGVIATSAKGVLDTVFDPAAPDTALVTYSAPAVMPTLALVGVNDTKGNNLAALTITSSLEVLGQFPGFEVSQVTGEATSALTASGISVSTAAAATPAATITATLTPAAADKNDALVIQNFLATPSITYGTTTKTFSTVGFGSWTSADEMASVTYMPYAEGISQIIYLTNTGVKNAEVAVTATDEDGNKYALGTLVTAAGNGEITKITDEVKQALRLQGFTKGKVSLDFIFVGVTPGAAPIVKVYSAYNVGGTDRGFVTNTTNGAK